MAKFSTKQTEAEGFRKPAGIKAKLNETKPKKRKKNI
jgi:hypothetical protein